MVLHLFVDGVAAIKSNCVVTHPLPIPPLYSVRMTKKKEWEILLIFYPAISYRYMSEEEHLHVTRFEARLLLSLFWLLMLLLRLVILKCDF